MQEYKACGLSCQLGYLRRLHTHPSIGARGERPIAIADTPYRAAAFCRGSLRPSVPPAPLPLVPKIINVRPRVDFSKFDLFWRSWPHFNVGTHSYVHQTLRKRSARGTFDFFTALQSL